MMSSNPSRFRWRSMSYVLILLGSGLVFTGCGSGKDIPAKKIYNSSSTSRRISAGDAKAKTDRSRVAAEESARDTALNRNNNADLGGNSSGDRSSSTGLNGTNIQTYSTTSNGGAQLETALLAFGATQVLPAIGVMAADAAGGVTDTLGDFFGIEKSGDEDKDEDDTSSALKIATNQSTVAIESSVGSIQAPPLRTAVINAQPATSHITPLPAQAELPKPIVMEEIPVESELNTETYAATDPRSCEGEIAPMDAYTRDIWNRAMEGTYL